MLIGCGSQPFLYPHCGQKSALAGNIELPLALFVFSSIVFRIGSRILLLGQVVWNNACRTIPLMAEPGWTDMPGNDCLDNGRDDHRRDARHDHHDGHPVQKSHNAFCVFDLQSQVDLPGILFIAPI